MEPNPKIPKVSNLQTPMMSLDPFMKLPDEIIQHILSFLRTKQAVQTSILARRWRLMWTAITKLNFDNEDFMTLGSFKNFVDKVTCLHNGSNLLSMRLSWPYGINEDSIAWIRYALNQKVQELEINFQTLCSNSIFDNLAPNDSLQVLKLAYGFQPQIPNHFTVDRLRTLHLLKIAVYDSSDKLISGCPILEELWLEDCFFKSIKIQSSTLTKLTIYDCLSEGKKIELSTPSLVSLTYDNPGMDCSLENLSSLDFASVFCFGFHGVKFLSSLYNAKVLILDCLAIESICEDMLPNFLNLKSLTLGILHPMTTSAHRQGLLSLLHRSPVLETLELGPARCSHDTLPFGEN